MRDARFQGFARAATVFCPGRTAGEEDGTEKTLTGPADPFSLLRPIRNNMKQRHTNRFLRAAGRLVSMIATTTGLATAQDVYETLAPMTVLGSSEDIREQVGSAAYLGAEEIREGNHLNVNEVLVKVPGVYVREEDGLGNFPNISIRGADGTRSEKVTVMEDGILAAPAPYSGPAAYMSPRVARMSGVEILKGSSQVRYGPQTTGGVINYLSTPIPEQNTFYGRATFGSDNTWFGHTYYGDTQETSAGKVGYLFELHGQTSDGFRYIDGSSGDTGYELWEPMLKLAFEPDTALKQRFEFKFGYTGMNANESYAGLTEADLARNPNRRYAATLHDNIEVEQFRTHFKWTAEPTDALRIESAVYFNDTSRNWYKLDKANGASIHEILAPGSALGTELGVLRGTAAGTTSVKANNRSYESYGWQNQANYAFETGPVAHDLAAGLRFHYDHQQRRHWLDTYNADGAGNFNFAGRTTIGQDNRLEEIFATAFFIEDSITTGNLTLRPGFRYEWLELDERRTDNATGTSTYADADENLWTAGLGANYRLNDCNNIYGGIYRGISSPGVSDYLGGVEPEESIGYELGFRHEQDHLRLDFTGFFTDFENLISTDTGLAGAPTQNAGEADVYGLETLAQYDAGRAAGLTFGLPVYVAATWTQAEFVGTTPGLAGGGDGIYAGGRDGNEIPYVPEWKLATGVGVDFEKWSANLDAVYTSSTWGTGFNGDPRPAGVTPTSRDGKIDSLLIFNFSGSYSLTDNVKLLGGIHNLFDERGIVSRIPEGPRANAPRTFYAGIEARF